ncbi:Peptidyl-prolyl isomerase cwc27 [Apophysomyces sp. BC1034]|nr:Peptidyl-prolyl isomerase cwc27 [Apophysomyces sp. BC1015]KAG0175009.1 Peptidyl-prolyl isomerase cwc27 [Apophysomyces sp. BC1021]KAG0188449.1 Peptidyl-prolyl isomerase cwc27 [Apophysomyces sp. BC1034]
MSNVYALEPHTNAKVILHTTAGDIEIEMWGKETPKATRNFIQLCMEGYYDNTIFHRIVPNFIVQGGDPTGTGQGGESIYDDEFPNEFHSRLRFTRRGLVGMANTGQDDNGSQFFITLDRADELTKKHTLFGRIVGDTVFNVVKLSEMETDGNERPLYPPRIKSTEILLNPFDDIIPRISEREKMVARAIEMQKAEFQRSKKKKKEKKKLNLLSFGEEAAEFEPSADAPVSKMKSSHDFAPEEQIVSAKVETKEALPVQPITSATAGVEESASSTEPATTEKETKESDKNAKSLSYRTENVWVEKTEEDEEEKKRSKAKKDQSDRQADKIEQLKEEIRKMDRRYDEEEEQSARDGEQKKKVSLIEQERAKYMRRGNAMTGGLKARKKGHKGGDDDTLRKLLAFQRKLSTAAPGSTEEKKKEEPICKLHEIPGCESCFDTTVNPAQEQTDEGWLAHSLIFEKDLKGKDLMQRRETVDDYVVIDPREREAQAMLDFGKREHKSDRKRDRDTHDRYSSESRKRDSSYDKDRKRSRRRDDDRRR